MDAYFNATKFSDRCIVRECRASASFLKPWLFAFMTFACSLNMSFEGIKNLRKYSKVIVIALVFLHLMMPMWAYFVSNVIFHDHFTNNWLCLSSRCANWSNEFYRFSTRRLRACRCYFSCICFSCIRVYVLFSTRSYSLEGYKYYYNVCFYRRDAEYCCRCSDSDYILSSKNGHASSVWHALSASSSLVL